MAARVVRAGTGLPGVSPDERVRCHAVRILVVAEQYPWPAVDGYRQRLHHLVAGLARAGSVEVVALDRRPEGLEHAAEERPEGVEDVAARRGGPDAGLRAWLPVWARGDMPRRVLAPDWSAVAAEVRRRVGTGAPVELVWYSHVDTWFPLHDEVAAAVASRRDGSAAPAEIVDFDNLEHLALRLRRSTPPRFAPGAGAPAKVRTVGRWGVSRAFDLVDERRWDRTQRACAAAVDHVVVCSDLDVDRSGCPNAVRIGNGASAPEHVHADRTGLRGAAPTMFFVGALDYEPNTEAVEWFVREVLPQVRAEVPDACVRIVGRGAERVAWAAEVPGVQLVGAVPELAAELDRADVSIVPIRVGAGTRLKVVEALANRLPLVTTTVGCEGIDVRDGHDALIADDAASFARACVRLLSDGALRQRLADAGAELFARRYDWDGIEASVADLARSTVRAAQERSRSTAGE
jgi:glycosyltransferase involved in cell wall biosynthesis